MIIGGLEDSLLVLSRSFFSVFHAAAPLQYITARENYWECRLGAKGALNIGRTEYVAYVRQIVGWLPPG